MKTKLRELREQKGYRQYEVAYKTKISPGLLSGFELGRVNPTPDEKERLAKVYKMDVKDVFPEKN